MPRAGFWRELLNTDAAIYGGSNMGNNGGVETEPNQMHGEAQSLFSRCRRWRRCISLST